MPFVALDKNTKERIDITKIVNPRLALKSGELICQLCEAPMMVKAGLVKRHHFAHYAECNSDYEQHPQSEEHLRGKEIVAEYASDWFKELTSAKPDFEVPIPEVRRVVDVLFEFPNGWRIACEVQLASITIEYLQKRTNDYLRAGIDVYWFFGKSAASDANLRWSIGEFGFALELEYRTISVRTQLTPEPIKL